MRSAIQTLAAQAVTLLTILGADEFVASAAAADEITTYRSHPPMRPLPTPAMRDLSVGPQRFVDAARGDDGAAGTQQAPWKSLRHSLRQLKPGDTLYLRGGTHYEKSFVSQSGSEGAPITISSYPGELAIIDGGLREFAESPRHQLAAAGKRCRWRIRLHQNLLRG